MNPRMDEVSDVIRAQFPLIGERGAGGKAGPGWQLTLTQRPRHIRVLLARGDDAYHFSVPNSADPAVVLQRAVAG